MLVGNLVAKLSLDAKGFASSLVKARSQMDKFNKGFSKPTTNPLKRAKAAVDDLGKSLVTIEPKIKKVVQPITALGQRLMAWDPPINKAKIRVDNLKNSLVRLRPALQYVKTQANQTRAQIAKLGQSFRKGAARIFTYVNALKAMAAVYATIRFAKMIANVESVNRRMAASIGSAEGVERAWAFLRGTSERLGVGLEDLATSYGSLAAAALSAGMSTDEVEKIFTAVTEKAAVLGMSSMRVRLTFLALEQMASKAVISMEELRRQFGENIPGAMGIFARALDVSVPMVNKWVASGRLMAKDVLPLLAHQMSTESADALDSLTTSMQKSISVMTTAWFDLKQTFSGTAGGAGGIKGTVQDTIEGFGGIITTVTKMTEALDEWLASVRAGRKERSEAEGKEGKKMIAVMDSVIAAYVGTAKELVKTDEEIAAARKKIHDDMNADTKESIDAWRDTVNNSMESVASEFTNLVTGLATGADVTVGKMLENMAVKLLDFTTTMLVVRPMLEWFKGWLNDVTQPGAAAGAGGWAFLFKALGASVSASAPAPDTAMADGGIINEPVVGIGLKSNSSYLLGESGPEAVVPTGAMGGGGANVSVNINAVDSKSVTDLMRRNPQAIIGPLVKAMNGGDRGLSTSMRMAVG